MVKIVVHITKVIIAVVASLLLSSCGFEQVKGNGNTVTKSRTVNASFNAISAERGLEVIIEQQNITSITVEADENLHEHIKTEVNDGELKITSDVNISDAAVKRITVSLPNIESIQSSSAAQVRSRNTLKGENIELSSSSGSALEVSVEAGSVTCDSSSGSRLTVKGKTGKLETNSSSGSTIDAKALTANSVIADASSGSSTYTNPVQNLSAEASSGANVQYINAPANLSKNTSSGGSVSQE